MVICFEACHANTPTAAPKNRQQQAYNRRCLWGLWACWAFYVLEPMLIEHGLGTSAGWCERLASDEPEACLPSPT
jgi:hypothetical protein